MWLIQSLNIAFNHRFGAKTNLQKCLLMRARKEKDTQKFIFCPPIFLFSNLNSMGRMSFWRYEKVPNEQTQCGKTVI
jgi:hypothetical protein